MTQPLSNQETPAKAVVVAIDGPAASGKGTLSQRIADAFGFAHLDTGVLYRAVGVSVLRAGGDPADSAAAARAAYELHPEHPILQEVALRTDEAAQAASKVAAVPEVRAALRGPSAGRRAGSGPGRARHRNGGLPRCPGQTVRYRFGGGPGRTATQGVAETGDSGYILRCPGGHEGS